jgi:hypothetical protein
MSLSIPGLFQYLFLNFEYRQFEILRATASLRASLTSNKYWHEKFASNGYVVAMYPAVKQQGKN